MDPRVKAIRDSKLVGSGSCTSIDECMGDEDLVSFLDEAAATTPDAAVKWAVDHEGLCLEQGLNQRWGEADDSQLVEYNRFNEARKAEGL